jgi:hypothetical protein
MRPASACLVVGPRVQELVPGRRTKSSAPCRKSEAVRTGLLTSLEECELMVDGVSDDKISDLTTNVLRGSSRNTRKANATCTASPLGMWL